MGSDAIPESVYFDTNSLRSKSGGYEILTSRDFLKLQELAATVGRPLLVPEVVVEEWLDALEAKLEEILQKITTRAAFIGDVLGRDPLKVEEMAVNDELRRQLGDAHRE